MELDILGYQFPGIENVEYDSDWLVVSARASKDGRSWKFREPCLLTHEAAELADWLESATRGRCKNKTLDFIEPNLAFELVKNRVIRIYFELESRPNWKPHYDNIENRDLYIDVPIFPEKMVRQVSQLKKKIRNFPSRA